jgi:F-type H+-transporting ATPase subunit a
LRTLLKKLIEIMLQYIHNQLVSKIWTALFVFLVGVSGIVTANELPTEEKKFNAGDLIIEHVADNHEWHIMGGEENPVSMPLPIIVYSKERGLNCFMSSNFHHGESTYNGYKLEHNKIIAVNEMEEMPADQATENEELTASIIDISITKNVAALFVSLIILVWMFMSVAKSYRRRPGEAPKGMQSLLEPLIIFVRDDVAKGSIGPKYQKYMPYLLTVFFFILINNLLGLIPILPGGANVTGNLAVTGTLAIITFIITTLSANKHYWRHVFAMPGVPIPVLIILTPIEILGIFLRPFVLMIRLFANITAGHIIALSFFSLIFIFGEMSTVAGFGVSLVSVAFVIFMTMLELLVAFLQAYVFTLLSAIYFGAAMEEHDHPHDENAHEEHPHFNPERHITDAALI